MVREAMVESGQKGQECENLKDQSRGGGGAGRVLTEMFEVFGKRLVIS